MGLPRSLAVLLLLMWFFCFPQLIRTQLPPSSISSSRALDSLLQDYAYRAFFHPKTGVVYDAILPSNLTGIRVSAMRLRSGSLRTRGVQMYKEFKIPVGVVEQPYSERLVLVYQNLGNWSMLYYPLPGYTYLAPVLGLLAYDASNLSAKNLPELDIQASGQPISINFSNVISVPQGLVGRCVWFDLQGSVNFSNLLPDNVCSTFQQGHFSIVVESIGPSPAPIPPPPGLVPKQAPVPRHKRNGTKVWIVVGSVVGGLALLILLGLMVMWMRKYKRKRKIQRMEKAADVGEALQMTTVGSTKAPAAAVTRTQPSLETEYVA